MNWHIHQLIETTTTKMSVRDKIQLKLILFAEENGHLVSGRRSRKENPSEFA